MKSIQYYLAKAINNPEKVFRKLDKVFFGGKIRGIINALKEREQRKLEQYIADHPEEYYDAQIKILSNSAIIGKNDFAVKDILLAQFQNGEGVFYDIAVRVLAIEQYYGKNNFGYDLYARMQNRFFGYGEFWLDRYIRLIQSYEQKALDKNHPIELDENLMLIDGAGRLALALYHDKEFIYGNVHKTCCTRVWNYSLLWELNFASEEIKLIREKAEELYDKCKYQYVGVIWPSAYHLRDEIVAEMDSYYKDGQSILIQNDNCRVLRYFDTKFEKLDFDGFVRAMYFADNMSESGLEWKNQIIMDCMPEDCMEYPVRVVYMNVQNPNIIRNEGNNAGRSLQITRLKRMIRSRFQDKVAHYEYDNIMHISDNYQQSKFCDMAMHFDRDISGLFEQLNKQYEYAIVKLDGRQSVDFPKSIYFYTDVDLLVSSTDVKRVGDVVEGWLSNKYGNVSDWVEVERIADEDEQIMVRVAIRGWTCFMIHIQTGTHFRMSAEFTKECLAKRQLSANEQLYVVSPQFELQFRAAELLGNPQKKWHRRYIEEHIDAYDVLLTNMAYAYDPNLFDKVQSIFTSILNEKS